MTYLRIIVNENFETYLSALDTIYALEMLINSKVKAYISLLLLYNGAYHP